jgi:hypothetical protein
MSLDAVISADLVKTRAEIAALSSVVASARGEIAMLITQLNSSSVIKSLQKLRVTPTAGRNTPNFSDVTIAAINPQKTVVWLRRTVFLATESNVVVDCEVLNATTLRCYSYGTDGSYYFGAGVIDIQVVEFK